MLRRWVFTLIVACPLAGASMAAPPTLTSAETSAAFRAAGFKPQGGQWVRCEDDVSASRQAGHCRRSR